MFKFVYFLCSIGNVIVPWSETEDIVSPFLHFFVVILSFVYLLKNDDDGDLSLHDHGQRL